MKKTMGLKPKIVHDHDRAVEILRAMYRYVNAGKRIPTVWFDELKEYYGVRDAKGKSITKRL